MSETNRCPQCQAEIPAGAPEGLCPQCLLLAGLEPKTAEAEPKTADYSPSGSRFVPPTPEALQPAFPQLEIIELLGKGGMGAVYKARQPGLDRLVAVKILPPEVSQDPAFAERFTREARALAMLNHPNIVGVYDSGHAGGYYYFVMEYLDGVNLRQAMRAGQLKAAEALKIVPQICDALQFAHDEGIVHRDIKPENILLDKKGRVKIADFGLAKLLGKTAPDVSLTGTQQVMGTMHYMAPEQLEGSRDIDHRADIYSLGVTFYEMLTGELPIGRFAAPSKKVQIDVRLDEVVLRSLEKSPEQRYQHASEIKTEVETIASGPVAAPAEVSADSPEVAEQAYAKFSYSKMLMVEWYRNETGIDFKDAIAAVEPMTELEQAVLRSHSTALAVLAYREQTGTDAKEATAAVEAITQKYGIHLEPTPTPLSKGAARVALILIVVPIGAGIFMSIFGGVLYKYALSWLALIGLPIIGAHVFAAIAIFHEWWIKPSAFLTKLWRTSLLIVGALSILILLKPIARLGAGLDGADEISVGIWPWLSFSNNDTRPDFQLFASWSLLAFPVGWLAFWAYRQSLAEAKHDLDRAPEPPVGARPMATRSVNRPWGVPVLGVINLLVGLVFLFASAAWLVNPDPVPAAIAADDSLRPLYNIWRIAEPVSEYVAAMFWFAGGIGLLLWKPWARRVTVATAIFLIAWFVLSIPAAVAFDIQPVFEGIQGEDPAVKIIATTALFLMFVSMTLTGLIYEIAVIVYLGRPRVVAAFNQENERPPVDPHDPNGSPPRPAEATNQVNRPANAPKTKVEAVATASGSAELAPPSSGARAAEESAERPPSYLRTVIVPVIGLCFLGFVGHIATVLMGWPPSQLGMARNPAAVVPAGFALLVLLFSSGVWLCRRFVPGLVWTLPLAWTLVCAVVFVLFWTPCEKSTNRYHTKGTLYRDQWSGFLDAGLWPYRMTSDCAVTLGVYRLREETEVSSSGYGWDMNHTLFIRNERGLVSRLNYVIEKGTGRPKDILQLAVDPLNGMSWASRQSGFSHGGQLNVPDIQQTDSGTHVDEKSLVEWLRSGGVDHPQFPEQARTLLEIIRRCSEYPEIFQRRPDDNTKWRSRLDAATHDVYQFHTKPVSFPFKYKEFSNASDSVTWEPVVPILYVGVPLMLAVWGVGMWLLLRRGREPKIESGINAPIGPAATADAPAPAPRAGFLRRLISPNAALLATICLLVLLGSLGITFYIVPTLQAKRLNDSLLGKWELIESAQPQELSWEFCADGTLTWRSVKTVNGKATDPHEHVVAYQVIDGEHIDLDSGGLQNHIRVVVLGDELTADTRLGGIVRFKRAGK